MKTKKIKIFAVRSVLVVLSPPSEKKECGRGALHLSHHGGDISFLCGFMMLHHFWSAHLFFVVIVFSCLSPFLHLSRPPPASIL
jgi:hypothetical protein